MTNKEILIQQCSDLNLSPKKSRRRKDKETGEYYYESTNSDLEDAIREYYINKYEKWYDKRQSVLPESINKITISDIRYMVNECVKQLIQ